MNTKHLDALLDKLPNGIAADPALDLKLLKESHAALVAIAQELAKWDGPNYSSYRALRGFQEDARAALALAKGGQQ